MIKEMIEAIKAKIRELKDEQILECLKEIGGGYEIEPEKRTVRACLIDVYEERHGEEAADGLMDSLGM